MSRFILSVGLFLGSFAGLSSASPVVAEKGLPDQAHERNLGFARFQPGDGVSWQGAGGTIYGTVTRVLPNGWYKVWIDSQGREVEVREEWLSPA